MPQAPIVAVEKAVKAKKLDNDFDFDEAFEEAANFDLAPPQLPQRKSFAVSYIQRVTFYVF